MSARQGSCRCWPVRRRSSSYSAGTFVLADQCWPTVEDEVVDILRGIANGQSRRLEQFACPLATLDQFAGRYLLQGRSRSTGFADIQLQHAPVDRGQFGNRLAGIKVIDILRFKRFVRLSPTQSRNRQHAVISKDELEVEYQTLNSKHRPAAERHFETVAAAAQAAESLCKP